MKKSGVNLKTFIHLPDPPAWFLARRRALTGALRGTARILSCAMVLLLSLVWIASALAAMTRPLLDLGTPRIGEAILAFANHLSLSPEATWALAAVLVVARLFLGIWLLLVLLYAAYERVRRDRISDGMLNAALLLSAIASIVAVAPVVMEPEPRLGALGELMLCVMASGLATFARGDQAQASAAPAHAGASLAPAVNPPLPLPLPPGSPQLP